MRWWEQLDAPLLGRYRVERLIGMGGMAEVLLARDERFSGKKVAIKAPNLDNFAPNQLEELLLRFQREVQRQGSEPIVGVVAMLDAGEVEDAAGKQHPFLVMDYLSGGSLGEQLGGSSGQRQNRQTLAEVNAWLRPIATTLDRLHSRKYLHRDVKPDNILFNADGDPFLADFGIATTLDDMAGAGTLMSVMGSAGPGSPGYQSPESLRGDKLAASDQFSLAVTVYEALTGRLPMAATTRDGWIAALANWRPTPISELLPSLPASAASTIMRALSAETRERFATCSEFALMLDRAAQAGAADARPTVVAAAPAPGAWPEPPPASVPPPAAKGGAKAAPARAAAAAANGGGMMRAVLWGGLVLLLLAVGVFAMRLLDRTSTPRDAELAQVSADVTPPASSDGDSAGPSAGTDSAASSSAGTAGVTDGAASSDATSGTDADAAAQAAIAQAAADAKAKAAADALAAAQKAAADKVIADAKAAADAKAIADAKAAADAKALADARAAEEERRKRRESIGGRWTGVFRYGSGTPGPVPFNVDMFTETNVVFEGRMVEPNTFGDASASQLIANLTGRRSGNRITFTKTYNGTGGQTHSVPYQGTLDTATMTVTGTWRIDTVSGSFEMKKDLSGREFR